MTPGRLAIAATLILLLAGCGGGTRSKSSGTAPAEAASSGVYGDRVISFAPVNSLGATAGDWPYFFDANLALGAPGGFFDVVSLGYDPSALATLGGTLTLGLGDAAGHRCIVDGPGDDLVVYENAFATTDSNGILGTNTEVGTVEVSDDAVTWHLFPPTIDSGIAALVDPARYSGFFGTIPTADGGNRFDLATVIAADGLAPTFQACFVRLTDGGMQYPDYGNTQTDLWASGADIDAIEALHSVAVPALAP